MLYIDYSQHSRKELIERISELEILNKELLLERQAETRLSFSWAGNLGHWYWNIKTGTVIFNPLKIEALGYSMDELPERVNYKFFTEMLHPEDYEKTMDAMKDNLSGKRSVYEVEYRIQTKDKKWKWFYDRGKVTQRDKNGKPLFASGIVFDITEKKKQKISLERKNLILKRDSETDELTQIRNRRSIMAELKSRIIESRLNKSPLTIGMFDIDKFKDINDSNGHNFGDKILKQVAKNILKSLRGLDSVGRYGGEEFLVILPNTVIGNGIPVGERIRRNIENYNYDKNVKVTISGGLKEFHGEEVAELIDEADRKLYEAKKAGRNKVLA